MFFGVSPDLLLKFLRQSQVVVSQHADSHCIPIGFFLLFVLFEQGLYVLVDIFFKLDPILCFLCLLELRVISLHGWHFKRECFAAHVSSIVRISGQPCRFAG